MSYWNIPNGNLQESDGHHYRFSSLDFNVVLVVCTGSFMGNVMVLKVSDGFSDFTLIKEGSVVF